MQGLLHAILLTEDVIQCLIIDTMFCSI